MDQPVRNRSETRRFQGLKRNGGTGHARHAKPTSLQGEGSRIAALRHYRHTCESGYPVTTGLRKNQDVTAYWIIRLRG
jgi:hypothetical protein